MDGHGLVSASSPPPTLISLALASRRAAVKPGKGTVALPGFVSVTPGSGVMAIAPFSVCHQVSTIGQRLPPIFSRYHIQASGLIGSPTEPSRRRLDMSCFFGHSSPHLM